jgi:phthiocerol/phenolphthiocerol synthesis type-I polyketide synthase E
LFSGLGAEHPAMGRGLYRFSPVFRSELERCDGLYREITGRPLLVRTNPPFGERVRFGRPSYVQPAVFSFQYALAAAWMAWGVRPGAVFGYSLGEDTAACIAGIAPLEDLMRLIVGRARHLDVVRGGGMAVLFAGTEQASALLAAYPAIDVAAANGPDSTVVSGPATAIGELLDAAAGAHIKARRVRTACAFHSRCMDPVLPAIEREAAVVAFRGPRVPLMSSVNGEWLSTATLRDPLYWSRRVRAPVRLVDALTRLHDEGFRTFLEIGAHPMLGPVVRRSVGPEDLVCVETARRGQDDVMVTAAALSQLVGRGGRALNSPFIHAGGYGRLEACR